MGMCNATDNHDRIDSDWLLADLLACRAHVMVAGTLSTFKSVSMDGTPFRNRILHARTS